MHSNFEVETENATIRGKISKALTDVQSNRNGNALLASYRELRPYLRNNGNRYKDQIRINYEGQRISFSMSARAYFIGGNFKVVYYNSNEGYTKATMDDMMALSGIESYIGISGGLTQVITHLSALTHKNGIRCTNLYDRNGFQLIYNALQLARYDAIPSSISPMWHIEAKDSRESNDVLALYGENNRFHMNFVLTHDTIEHGIEKAESKRYFVYSSNAFNISVDRKDGREARNENCWENQDSGKMLVEKLGSSSRLKNGSAYMAASVSMPVTIMLRKESRNDDGMHLYSYCTGTNEHAECVHSQ
ncbi:MAG: hypothetical protein QXT94_02755 [Methanothrix sp.]